MGEGDGLLPRQVVLGRRIMGRVSLFGSSLRELGNRGAATYGFLGAGQVDGVRCECLFLGGGFTGEVVHCLIPFQTNMPRYPLNHYVLFVSVERVEKAPHLGRECRGLAAGPHCSRRSPDRNSVRTQMLFMVLSSAVRFATTVRASLTAIPRH